MAKSGGGKGDIDSLPMRGAQATQAVNALGKSFDSLARSGKFTHQNLNEMLMGLGRMHPALGAVATAARLTVLSFQLLEQVDKDFRYKEFGEDITRVGDAFQRNVGIVKAMAGAEAGLATQSALLANKRALISKHISDFNLEMAQARKRAEELGDAEAGQIAQLNDSRKVHEEKIKNLEGEAAAIEKTIDAIREETNERKRNAAAAFDMRVGAATAQKEGLFFSETRRKITNELKMEEYQLQQLVIAQNKLIDNGGIVSAESQRAVADTQARIDALRREGETYGLLAQMADDALRGVAVGAFDAYAEALDKTVSLNALFAGGFDRSLRNMAASTVRSVGQQAAVKAVFETAAGFAALAIRDGQGAKDHFISAGIFGSIAVGSGVGAGLLSVNPVGGGGGRGGSGGGGGSSGGDGGDTINQQIFVLGALDAQALESLYEQMAEAARNRDLAN